MKPSSALMPSPFRNAPYILGIGIFVALVLAIVKYVYEAGQMWGWW